VKTEQIILQLQSRLPVLSPFFANRLGVTAVAKIGAGVIQVTTESAHGLGAGGLVTLSGIQVPVEVDTFVETATEITLNLLTPHAFTFNANAPLDRNQEVVIYSGSEANRTYILKSVPNRNKLILTRGSATPLPDDVTLYVQETFPYGYNGLKTVTAVPTPTTFRFVTDFDQAAPIGAVEEWLVHTSPRISGAVDYQTLLESYTEQPDESIWAFVVLADNQANKDRLNQNDATTTQGRQADFRQKIITGFSIFIFVPNKGEILTKTNGRVGRDLIEDIRRPIFQSILGVDLESDLYAQGQGIIPYNGDQFVSYNGAFYVHEFQFQQVIEITSRDTAIRHFERAFRDVSVIHRNQFSELTTYLSQINLDEEPE